jgi:hypothetical protein
VCVELCCNVINCMVLIRRRLGHRSANEEVVPTITVGNGSHIYYNVLSISCRNLGCHNFYITETSDKTTKPVLSQFRASNSCRAIIEKLVEVHVFRGDRRFITLFTRTHQWSLYQVRRIQSLPSSCIFRLKICTHFSFFSYGLHVPPIPSSAI